MDALSPRVVRWPHSVTPSLTMALFLPHPNTPNRSFVTMRARAAGTMHVAGFFSLLVVPLFLPLIRCSLSADEGWPSPDFGHRSLADTHTALCASKKSSKAVWQRDLCFSFFFVSPQALYMDCFLIVKLLQKMEGMWEGRVLCCGGAV